METSYAQALWKLAENGTDPKKAVRMIAELLAQSGRSALLPRIKRAFERHAEQQLKKSGAVLTIAREKDERHAKTAVKDILADLGIEGRDLKTQIDDTVIGGWRLEAKGRLFDETYKKQLMELYNRSIH